MGLCIYCENINYYKRRSETEAYCPVRRQYYEVDSIGCFEYENSHMSAMACRTENERGIQNWKQKTGNNDCFVTTVVCKILKKEDQCLELETLRYLRDHYMLKEKRYLKPLLEYYKVGPMISNCLLEEKNVQEKASLLYFLFIEPAVSFILQGHYEEASNLYMEMITHLKKLYHLEDIQ